MSKSSSAPNVYNSHRLIPCARVFVSKYISGMCDVVIESIFLSVLILSVFIIRFLVMQIHLLTILITFHKELYYILYYILEQREMGIAYIIAASLHLSKHEGLTVVTSIDSF